MIRDFITFEVEGDTCFAACDHPEGEKPSVGLLMVSGGNEIRSGAFAGQATLAATMAEHGYPAFRFDRRGIGDSEGQNTQFRSAGADIHAALTAFQKACPTLERIVGFGNCDAAASLMLSSGAGCRALVLANPWTFDEGDEDSVPAEAARKRYLEKLANPREWKRVLSGKISFSTIANALKSSTSRGEPTSQLAQDMSEAMRAFDGPVRYLVAGRDRTGLAFKSVWDKDEKILECPGADHAFSGAEHSHWLTEQILSALDEQAREFNMR